MVCCAVWPGNVLSSSLNRMLLFSSWDGTAWKDLGLSEGACLVEFKRGFRLEMWRSSPLLVSSRWKAAWCYTCVMYEISSSPTLVTRWFHPLPCSCITIVCAGRSTQGFAGGLHARAVLPRLPCAEPYSDREGYRGGHGRQRCLHGKTSAAQPSVDAILARVRHARNRSTGVFNRPQRACTYHGCYCSCFCSRCTCRRLGGAVPANAAGDVSLLACMLRRRNYRVDDTVPFFAIITSRSSILRRSHTCFDAKPRFSNLTPSCLIIAWMVTEGEPIPSYLDETLRFRFSAG